MIVPIGSVVEIQKQKFVVAGYSPFLKKGEILPAYTTVPYPLGYLNPGKTLVFPIDEVDTILARGYEGTGETEIEERKAVESPVPIGTIVRIKGKKKLYMIAGYYPSGGECARQYAGVLYPNGMMTPRDLCLFDGNEIEQEIWRGYLDREAEKLLEALPGFLEESSELVRKICEFVQRVENETKRPEESNEISITMD